MFVAGVIWCSHGQHIILLLRLPFLTKDVCFCTTNQPEVQHKTGQSRSEQDNHNIVRPIHDGQRDKICPLLCILIKVLFMGQHSSCSSSVLSENQVAQT